MTKFVAYAMMKSFWVLILCFLVLLQPMLRASLFANYQVNKAFVAKYLCEKRSVAKNSCQGKCHLKKQLAKTSDTDKKGNQNEKVNLETQIELTFLVFHVSKRPVEVLPKVATPYLENQAQIYPDPIFHPPSVLMVLG